MPKLVAIGKGAWRGGMGMLFYKKIYIKIIGKNWLVSNSL